MVVPSLKRRWLTPEKISESSPPPSFLSNPQDLTNTTAFFTLIATTEKRFSPAPRPEWYGAPKVNYLSFPGYLVGNLFLTQRTNFLISCLTPNSITSLHI